VALEKGISIKAQFFFVSLLSLFCSFPLLGEEIRYGDDVKARPPSSSVPATRSAQEVLAAVPWVNLRRNPRAASPSSGDDKPVLSDPDQISQVLLSESLWVLEEQDGWLFVEAPEQPAYARGEWKGLSGWVRQEDVLLKPVGFTPNATVCVRYGRVQEKKGTLSRFLSVPMGARVFVIFSEKKWARVTDANARMGWIRLADIRRDRDPLGDEQTIRKSLVDAALAFLGEPVCPGGRTGHRPKEKYVSSGVDTDGLVNLAYRSAGFQVPRLAPDQFRASAPIERASDLRPGDLVFLSGSETGGIDSVLFYEGGENLIQAKTGDRVKRVQFSSLFGKSKRALVAGSLGTQWVQFGKLIRQ